MKSQGLPLEGLKGLAPPNIPTPRAIGLGLLIVLGILLVWSSVFMVKTEEVGVVLTFGKYSRQADPGLRIKWPWPVQTVVGCRCNASSKQSSVSAPSAPACARSIPGACTPMSR